MNRDTSTRALVESGLMTALTVVLIIAAQALPLLGYVAMFVWPLPVAMLYVRHGKKYSLMALAASGLVSGLILGDFITPVFMVLSLGFASVILGYCVAHKKPAYLTIVLMGIAIFIGALIMLKAYSAFFHQDLIAMTIDTFNQSIVTVKRFYASMNVPDEAVSKAFSSIDTSKLVMIMPIMLACSSLMMALICYLIAVKLFNRFKIQADPVKPFSQWYLPSRLVFAVTIAVLLAYLSSYAKWNMAESYFNNAYMAFIYMFTINGLCSLDYFLKSKGLPNAPRIIICILVAFSGLSTILIFIGLIENALNLRKLDKSRVRRV